MPSVCPLPGSPSLNIDLQTPEAVSVEFCLILLDHVPDIDYTPMNTSLKLKISTIQGRLAYGAQRTVVHNYQLDLYSETELWIQVKVLLFDNAYRSKVVNDKNHGSGEWKCLI